MTKNRDILLLFISILVFISTFTFFVNNNYIITAIFAVFLIIQCYFGNINIWISILLGIGLSLAEGIPFYFMKNTEPGVAYKFKHVDIQLTQQSMWDILWYAIFNNMILIAYNIFNTSSKFNLTFYNFYYSGFIAILSLILWVYFNYNHNLLALLLFILAILLFYKVKIDLNYIIASLIIFPVMEHIYISLSNVYVPVKTPGEIFIGEEPLYWFSFYVIWIILIPFVYYFINKLNIFN